MSLLNNVLCLALMMAAASLVSGCLTISMYCALLDKYFSLVMLVMHCTPRCAEHLVCHTMLITMQEEPLRAGLPSA